MNGATDLLPKYAPQIAALSPSPSLAELAPLLLHDVPPMRIYFAPFEWVNESARVALVGITPGEHSMLAALMEARRALHANLPLSEVGMRAKQTGSFSNMRGRLAKMLDALGVADVLGIASTASMFGADAPNRHLLHTTSAVRYPVFVDEKNYTGHKPKLIRSDVLMGYAERYLGDELGRLNSALIVPCGEIVTAVLGHLARKGIVDEGRCLLGFPHASGLNSRCGEFFEQRRADLKNRVDEWSRAK